MEIPLVDNQADLFQIELDPTKSSKNTDYKVAGEQFTLPEVQYPAGWRPFVRKTSVNGLIEIGACPKKESQNFQKHLDALGVPYKIIQ